jgi:hypothetical protein
MPDSEIVKLYNRVTKQIDQAKENEILVFNFPTYTKEELIDIPKILAYLKAEGEIEIPEGHTPAMTFKAKKIKKMETETSIFNNLEFEKDEDQIEAEKRYKICVDQKHNLIKKSPLLICTNCKLGYHFKLGGTKFSKVVKITI